MIRNGKGWYCLAVKKLSALLRGTTSKHHGGFYCLNLPHNFVSEKKFISHKQYVEIKISVAL